MYSKILIPTDGSDGAVEAIKSGLKLAKRIDAVVHTLYVIDTRFVVAEYDPIVEEAEREAERALEQVEELGENEDISVYKHLRAGIPHDEIVDATEAYGCDVVVMGTHGRTGIDRFVHVGSVAERVIRTSSVHVITVPLDSSE